MPNAICFLTGFINRKTFCLFAACPVLIGLTMPSKCSAEDCNSATDQTNMSLCAIEESHKADEELAIVYNKLMAKITSAAQPKLRAAEEAWINYRNKQCKFDTLGSSGGSIHAMVFALCYEDITLQQTKRLQEQLDCEEGNASCGGQ